MGRNAPFVFTHAGQHDGKPWNRANLGKSNKCHIRLLVLQVFYLYLILVPPSLKTYFKILFHHPKTNGGATIGYEQKDNL